MLAVPLWTSRTEDRPGGRTERQSLAVFDPLGTVRKVTLCPLGCSPEVPKALALQSWPLFPASPSFGVDHTISLRTPVIER